MDLGANLVADRSGLSRLPLYASPEQMVGGALLAFTLSIDDFVISFFTWRGWAEYHVAGAYLFQVEVRDHAGSM